MTQTIKKKPHTSAYKFRVAIAALKGDKTVPQLCQEFGVVHSQIYKWKTELLERGASLYDQGFVGVQVSEQEIDKLHATIGRLKVENDFLGRALGRSR
jgi:transposase